MDQLPPKPETIQKYMDNVLPAYALMAGIELDIFSVVSDQPKTREEIASELDLNLRQITILLRALVAAELMTKHDDRFANTAETAFYLVKDSPGYMAGGHPFIRWIWDSVAQTTSTIRAGVPKAHFDYHTEEIKLDDRPMAEVFHGWSLEAAKSFMEQFDMSQHKHIVDIGGGSGAVAITFTDLLPEVEVTVVDLQAMLSLAEEFVNVVPQKERIHLVNHDIVAKSMPGNFDGATMKAFTVTLSPDENARVMRHAFELLKPGGSLYIMASVLNDDGVSPASKALGNLMYLNIYYDGQAYTESEYREWLSDAGFTDIENFALEQGDTIFRALKPS